MRIWRDCCGYEYMFTHAPGLGAGRNGLKTPQGAGSTAQKSASGRQGLKENSITCECQEVTSPEKPSFLHL